MKNVLKGLSAEKQYAAIDSAARKYLSERIAIPDEDVHKTSLLKDDLGLDSLDRVELVMEIERKIGVSLSDEDVEQMDDLESLIQTFIRCINS